MELKGKYTIELKIMDNSNFNIVKTSTVKILKKLDIKTIENILYNYDNKNYKKCYQCKKYNHINNMSKPEGLNILICQKCLKNIMNGSIKLID